MRDRLPTGVDVLDRKLDGGIPAGSTVALCAEPASQAELLLHELTATRGTLYITLGRTEEAVADSIANSSTRTGEPTIRHVSGDAPIDNAAKLVSALPEASNLIVDPVDVLERESHDRYRNFLNELQNHIHNTQGLAILHCLAGNHLPQGRDTTRHMADVVFDLETRVGSDSIENRLTVPKFRGGRALTDVVKLELADSVAIDTSRDIA
ncbi:RAD55 family ATPase [Halomarina litorea]|uniref:RAD55 family ATPase n=1 Tax=Halomarina litorea TaxID=2961595 RepID=UPI0020C3DB79|nr:transcriptional regulator [Halomarina sp. BCD28]